MTREPAGKAQLIAALIALATYLIQKYLQLLPEEMDLVAPIVGYVVAQVVGWLWARQQTTPVVAPQLPEGRAVKLPDGKPGIVVRK